MISCGKLLLILLIDRFITSLQYSTNCFYPGFVERVNQMKRVYYVTIVLATPIMKVMMLRFIMHKLEVVAIVAMPMRGIQRGEFVIFVWIFIFDLFVLNRR